MDQRGSIVKETICTDHEVRMELNGLSSGLYMLQVVLDGATPVFRKVMVE